MNIREQLYHQKKRNVKIVLEKNLDNLGINKIFIQKFLMNLWENPQIMFNILNNADLKELNENLAPFIVDNFYNNYLSGNYVENNLLYIFTLMLNHEINNLNDNERALSFLGNNSRCGILLGQLSKKIDVQIYFQKMILRTVSKIENCSSMKINFNVNEINKKLSWLKSERNPNNNEILKNAKDTFKHKGSGSSGESKNAGNSFLNNFLTDINIQYLEKICQDEKYKDNQDLLDHFGKLIADLKNNNKEFYSNSVLIQNLYHSNNPPDILAIYKEQITEIISFINILIEDLTSNTFLIPYSVKCICKIIFILIKQKFKTKRTVEINAFISKFFLEILLIPIISSPTNNAYITDFVISENTLKNINTTNKILSKLFSGCLFKNNDKEANYTSFNKFFLEKMPQILYFFQKAVEVKLPNFIENFLENKLEKNFEYDYFEENKESIYTNISLVFKISNIESLIKGVKKCGNLFTKKENKKKETPTPDKKDKNDKFEKFKLIFNKLEGGETIQSIKTVEEKIIKEYSIKLQTELELEKKKDKTKKEKISPVNEIECYFLFLEEIYEKKYKYIFKLEKSTSDYYIELKSLKLKELTSNQKVLINVKNYLCATLGNYRILNITDFNQNTVKSTIDILEEIKNYITLPNFILNNNTIPSEWYINSLLDNLPLLEVSFQDNDYVKLYEELYKNLDQSIQTMNFNFLIILRNRIKFIDKAKDYYENIENSVKDILINEEIKKMTESTFLPVEVQFKYDDKNTDVFKIKFSNIKEKNFENKTIIQDPKKDFFIFRNIESFASNFPNLVEYQYFQDENPLEIIDKLKMAKSLKEYFQLIREKILKKGTISEEDFDTLYQNKITDYFMNKIYDKIYPIEPENKDTEIFIKTTMLSWIEPNLIINKDYIYETSLPDIIHQFQNVNAARTPHKKFSFIQKILELMNNIIIFNEGEKKDISLDDVTPVLFYIFIKAHPYKFYTDLEFIKLFLDAKKGLYSFNIKQMESAINMVLTCNEKNFGMTREEFDKRCKSTRNIKNQ